MDLFSDEFYSLEEAAASGTAGRAPLEKTTGRDFAAIEFALHWQSEHARHSDLYVANQLNLWRDFIPPELEPALLDKPVGHSQTVRIAPGQLIPAFSPAECPEIETRRFERRVVNGRTLEPHAGRFYPRGFIPGVRDCTADSILPFRIGRIDGDRMTVDLNHPLAGKPLSVTARILKAWQAGAQRGGTVQDVPELIAGKGPGMQARWQGAATDFFTDDAFRREREEADGDFYRAPRLVDHLDRTATHQVEKLYARLLPKGARVLDLMTSWKSHLDLAEPDAVAGLGMNAEELAANPRLSERAVQDLNLEPHLAYAEASFDAVVCTVSVEYLTRPVEVFAEVRRVLKPGGRFILVFSNRYFPPKVVRVWADAHPFERTGLVIEYFLHAGGFKDLASFSLAGLFRPEDDRYAGQTPWSDPVHAVLGDKA
ncbi:MAG: methyltransferase domain-containing protein [Hydrogenophilales bacterium]|nr:methyltransferase domain-containing protein [Hydrogenophilales bacterium]